MRRASLGMICAAALALGLAPAARAAFDDPLFVFAPTGALNHTPAPAGYFEGPCGLAVDSQGRFYLADYYHHAVDLYSPSAGYAGSPTNGATGYVTQLANEDPIDGPCGLALDSSNNLYVNNYHRNVAKFGPAGGFAPGPVGDSADSTGVAVDPATDDVYVDDRTLIAEYDSSGTPLGQIGAASLGDGYGIAVSGYSGTAGYIYVPDAQSDTVKVYDPATDTDNPVDYIFGPPGGFADLHDSAVAVDNVTGEVYVIDTLGPQYSEHPQATVDVFDSAGNYEGRLKYNVVNGGPSGLAVDNSPTGTQGRVYVSSGISVQASVYAYPPGAATSTALPASFALSTASTGSGAISSDLGGVDCSSSCQTQIRSGAQVTLSATPAPGSTFTGWSGGGCEGTGDCTVAMSEARSVSATFEATQQSASNDQGASSPAPQSPPASAPAGSTRPKHRASHRRHHHQRHHRRRVRHRHPRHHRKRR